MQLTTRPAPHAQRHEQPPSCYIGAHYLTVYSTVKGTRRTPNAVRQSEEMDLFFLGLTTGQRAVIRYTEDLGRIGEWIVSGQTPRAWKVISEF